MNKGLVMFLCLLLTASMIIIPIPSEALDYGMDHDIGAVNASFHGEAASDYLGRDTKIIGDVNGDGFDDILIGAYINDDGGTSAGKTYLLFGKASGWAMDTIISNADASFIGEIDYDYSGWMVADAGDVNNDGYDDILIGAYGSDEGGSMAGQIYLILGKATGWKKDMDLSEVNISFIGEAAGDYAGNRLTGVGDVNGDGFDDFLISAKSNDEGANGAGQVYLILGKASGFTNDTDLSNVDASFIGESASDVFGSDVAGVGDVNGDGYDDFIISAIGNDESAPSAGQTYLFFGRASGWEMDRNMTNADASFLGEAQSDNSGGSIAGAGDVNRDGYNDFLIGAHYNDQGATNVGQTYLIFGNDTGWKMDADLSEINSTFVGEVLGDYSGRWVSGAGDVNGDGFDDFLISSTNNDDSGSNSGQCYLFLGKASGWSNNTSLSTAASSFLGEADNDYLGYRFSGDGDVNGDGYDDILIAAIYSDESYANAGQVYLIFPDINSNPSSISSVKAFDDDSYSNEISVANIYSDVYIELQGLDGNSSRKDIAIVNVTTNESCPWGIGLRLMESGSNTGTYRGSFTIKNRTHEDNHWIKGTVGENLTIASTQDPSKNVTLVIEGNLVLYPLEDNDTAQEDMFHNERYWVIDWSNVDWTFETNASWLEWNTTVHNISGTPDNGDIGSYWIRVNASSLSGYSDEHNFSIAVNNTPPNITTADVTGAVEDLMYIADYNSSDDGQGTITWHLETDAGDWLAINSSTGVISGNPMNEHVGEHYVNVSVDDGNNGWDHSNFTLTVVNTNDAPEITTEDNVTAYEDMLYLVHYEVEEIDVGDSVTWTFDTNATEWLTMDLDAQNLSGTPTNEDVGKYWVHIIVNDTYQAKDEHNFTLTVVNVNDPPVITSTPETNATVLFKYSYQITATDEDVGSTLSYFLDAMPEGMTIDEVSGLVEWTPSIDQGGLIHVVVGVNDSMTSVTQAFDINVTVPESFPPRATLLLPTNDSIIEVTNPDLSWSVEDPDSETIYFDVYLDQEKDKVGLKDPTSKMADGITATVFTPSGELEKGKRYYWTVIPNDGSNIGPCLSGIWSFTVKEDAVVNDKPSVVLNSPIDGQEIEELPVQLEWSGTDPDSTVIYYDIYLGSDREVVEALTPAARIGSAQTENSHIVDNLQAGVTYFWTVIPSDGENTGNCLSGTWSFKMASTVVENHAPVITSQPVVDATTGEPYTYDVEATDEDGGDVVTYSLVMRPDNMIIDAQTGLIVWTPSSAQLGDIVVTVKVSDGRLYVLQTFTVKVTDKMILNNIPVITSIPNQTILEGDEYVYQVAASDADAGDVLNYSLEGAPDRMSISSEGLIRWRSEKGQNGEYTITVNVTDGRDHAIAHFKITVEKKADGPTSTGLDSTMLAIIVVVVVIIILVTMMALMRKKDKGPMEEEEEEEAEEEEEEEEPVTEEKEEVGVEDEDEGPEAELEDEIDLDDLEDEGEDDR